MMILRLSAIRISFRLSGEFFDNNLILYENLDIGSRNKEHHLVLVI